jgi:hypothetical protein
MSIRAERSFFRKKKSPEGNPGGGPQLRAKPGNERVSADTLVASGPLKYPIFFIEIFIFIPVSELN